MHCRRSQWGDFAIRCTVAGHNGAIFAIAVDDVADHLISSGKDGVLLLRTGGGQELVRMQIPQPAHYACAMDIDAGPRALFAAAMPKEHKTGPSILHFPLHQGQVVTGPYLPY